MAIAPLNIPGYAQPQTLDWTPLADLGKTIQTQRKQAALGDIMSGADFNNPQSLQALATQAYGIDPSTGMTLANLGISLQNRQEDQARHTRLDERQLARDKVADANSAAYLAIARQNAARADQGPEETAAQRAKAARAYGIDPTTSEGRAYVLTGKLPESNTTIQNQTDQRKAAAASLGLTPEHPAYNSFVLTGKMPREDAQPLTATDKKAILEADEGVMTAKSAIDALSKAKELSPKALGFKGAGNVASLGALLGNQASVDTVELDNTVTSNALTQLKSIFGGNPTEGERKIMLDIQGSSSLPDTVRQKIYDRAIGLAQNRLKFNEQRAAEMRGGQFYKPQGGMTRAPLQQSQGINQQQYEALPSGSVFTAPDGTQRVKP
ncbi:MAG: hypothetical protein QG592_1652 [Pseudomonadota bacterium]|nr:hypothetical protein [Pseudomonadota bacterium]MDQ5960569.1 hypothetical protein [Pseudomonadota bacterium]